MDRFFSTYTDFFNQVKSIIPQLFTEESEKVKKNRKKKEKRDSEKKKETRDLDEPRVERETREAAEAEEIKAAAEELEKQRIWIPESFADRLVFFVENWYPHMAAASTCDEVYFENIHVKVFNGLELQVIMDSLIEKNRIIVWNYLHTLFALSVSLPYTKDNYTNAKLDNEELSEERKILLKQIQETIQQFPTLVANIVSWKRKITEQPNQSEQPAGGANNGGPPLDASFFENSQLGFLAREIASEIDPSEVLNMDEMKDPSQLFSAILNQDENSGFGKLMKNVYTKLQSKMESGQVDQRRLFDESKQLLGGLSNGMPMPPGGAAGMPDFSNFASMAQNLAAMGDLFGGASPAPSGGRRQSARSLRRRMQRRAKKMEKQRKEQEEAAAVATAESGASGTSGTVDAPPATRAPKKRHHKRKNKRKPKPSK